MFPGLADLRGNVRKEGAIDHLLDRSDDSAIRHHGRRIRLGGAAHRAQRVHRGDVAVRHHAQVRRRERHHRTFRDRAVGHRHVSRSRADRPELEPSSRSKREVGHDRRARDRRAPGGGARRDRARFDAPAAHQRERRRQRDAPRRVRQVPRPGAAAAAGAHRSSRPPIRLDCRSTACNGRPGSTPPGERPTPRTRRTRCEGWIHWPARETRAAAAPGSHRPRLRRLDRLPASVCPARGRRRHRPSPRCSRRTKSSS